MQQHGNALGSAATHQPSKICASCNTKNSKVVKQRRAEQRSAAGKRQAKLAGTALPPAVFKAEKDKEQKRCARPARIRTMLHKMMLAVPTAVAWFGVGDRYPGRKRAADEQRAQEREQRAEQVCRHVWCVIYVRVRDVLMCDWCVCVGGG